MKKREIADNLTISLYLGKLKLDEFIEFQKVVKRLFHMDLRFEVTPIVPKILKKKLK